MGQSVGVVANVVGRAESEPAVAAVPKCEKIAVCHRHQGVTLSGGHGHRLAAQIHCCVPRRQCAVRVADVVRGPVPELAIGSSSERFHRPIDKQRHTVKAPGRNGCRQAAQRHCAQVHRQRVLRVAHNRDGAVSQLAEFIEPESPECAISDHNETVGNASRHARCQRLQPSARPSMVCPRCGDTEGWWRQWLRGSARGRIGRPSRARRGCVFSPHCQAQLVAVCAVGSRPVRAAEQRCPFGAARSGVPQASSSAGRCMGQGGEQQRC